MAIRRVIFKRMLEGDLRKLRKESADASSGGGARDLRFGPWELFEPVVDRMLPQRARRISTRKFEGKYVKHPVQIHVGEMRWQDGDRVDAKSFEFWPPTGARGFEGRVATAYRLPPLAADRLPPAGEGMVFALIWEDDDGIWAQYVSEAAIRNPPAGEEWEASTRTALLDGLDRAQAKEAKQKGTKPVAIRGFVDRERRQRETFVGRS